VVLIAALRSRIWTFVDHAAARLNATLRRLTRPLPLVTGLAADLLRSRRELVAENALLRQRLVVASRRVKGPTFRPLERGLLALLARLAPRWRDALLLVKPETVLRWHPPGGVPTLLAPHVESRCSPGAEACTRPRRPHPTNGRRPSGSAQTVLVEILLTLQIQLNSSKLYCLGFLSIRGDVKAQPTTPSESIVLTSGVRVRSGLWWRDAQRHANLAGARPARVAARSRRRSGA
jgi:hypothetical protein